MSKVTDKHAAKIPGTGKFVDAGPDLAPKKPLPYKFDEPTDVPFPGKRQNEVGGPCDLNYNGIDDSEE